MTQEAEKLYQEAIGADEEYSKAIRAQFGKNKNRFDVNQKDYNESTKSAFLKKINADEKWINFIRNGCSYPL